MALFFSNGEPMIKENVHEDYIRRVRSIGESLIKNAESIVGSEKNLESIHISVDVEEGCLNPINVTKSFYPERVVDDE